MCNKRLSFEVLPSATPCRTHLFVYTPVFDDQMMQVLPWRLRVAVNLRQQVVGAPYMDDHSLEQLWFIGDVVPDLLILILEFELLSPHVIAKPSKRRRLVLFTLALLVLMDATRLIISRTMFKSFLGG